MDGTIDAPLRDAALESDALENWAAPTAQPDCHVFYFCPEVSDASTLKRVQQFLDHGYGVTVFGFHRKRYNTGFEPAWPFVPLGLTVDGKYWHRLRALMGALPVIFACRRRLKTASLLYARNIDQLLLALVARLFAFSRSPVVYEVLDIPPFMTKGRLASRILRWIERICLRRVKMLVLSSPAFHRNFYAAIQKYGGDWFLLENKLHPSIVEGSRPRLPAAPRERGKPWVVGYFGLIRGQATFDLMTRLAERLQGSVIFKFRGALTTVDHRSFATALSRLPNMEFGGSYLPHQDLQTIYSDVDFAWALDLEHTEHNSRWLMPCRFYEAGYFGVPCLAVRSFEVGAMLERHRIGFTFERPLEEQLVQFFETLQPADYEHICSRLRAVPTDMFVANDDTERLCAKLDDFMPQHD